MTPFQQNPTWFWTLKKWISGVPAKPWNRRDTLMSGRHDWTLWRLNRPWQSVRLCRNDKRSNIFIRIRGLKLYISTRSIKNRRPILQASWTSVTLRSSMLSKVSEKMAVYSSFCQRTPRSLFCGKGRKVKTFNGCTDSTWAEKLNQRIFSQVDKIMPLVSQDNCNAR